MYSAIRFAIVSGAIALAGEGGAVAVVAAASPSPAPAMAAPTGAATFTGRLLFDGTCSGEVVSVDDEVSRSRGQVCTPTVDASDPRLSGRTQNRANADEYVIDGDAGGFYWGEMTITNDGGSWVGTWTGFSRPGSDWGGDFQFMVGQGGYEGLVAAWHETSGAGNWLDLEGIIVEGTLPPSVVADLPDDPAAP